MAVPENTVALLGAPNPDKSYKLQNGTINQVMQWAWSHQLETKVKESAATGSKMEISLGKEPTLRIRNEKLPVFFTPQSFRTELYEPTREKDQLRFVGLVSQHIELKKLKKAEEAAGNGDQALMELQSKMASYKKERESKTTVFVEDRSKLPPAKGEKRPAAQRSSMAFLKANRPQLFKSHSTTRSMPTSPALGASRSAVPLIANIPTPAPLDEKSQKLQALKTPLLHLLAIRPVSEKFLSQKLHCSPEDCNQILQKVGKPARLDPSKWDLSDRAFKELDVWKFRYPSQDDRQAAIDRAVSAFDRMRLSREDKIWQVLLPKAERGKGKILSKLHLHGGPIQKSVTPRINVQSTEDSNNGYTTGNDTDSRKDRLAPSDAEPMARSLSHDPIKKRKVSEKEAQSKRLLSKKPKLANPSSAPKAKESLGKAKDTKPVAKKEAKRVNAPSDAKVKSAEFVHDSDEEDGLDSSMASDKQRAEPKDTPASTKLQPKKPVKQVSEKPDETKLSKVKDSVKRVDTPNGTTKSMATPPSSSSSGSKPRLSDSNGAATAMKKTLSRQRTTSSPMKPSPLGSSPPTNASDFENEGRSYLGSSSSSSPLVTQNRKIAGRKEHNPGTAHKTQRPVQNTSDHTLKRKANDVDSDIHNHGTPVTNGHAHPAKRQQIAVTSSQESDSSSGASPPLISAIIQKAQQFKNYYARYEKLYRELSGLANPPREKTDALMKMHNRLQELKQEIARGVVS